MATRTVPGQLRLLKDRLPSDFNERRFMKLVDAMAFAVTVKFDGIIVYANQAAARIFKARDTDTLVGQPASDFWHPEERETMQERRRLLHASSDPLPMMEQRRHCVDGSTIWVESSGVTTDWMGKTAVLSVLRDVTKRQEAEVEITQRQEEYRQLVQLSPDPMIVVSDGMIVFANPAAYDTFGASDSRPLQDLSINEIFLTPLSESWPDTVDDDYAPTKLEPTATIDLRKLDGTPLIGDIRRARVSWDGKRATQIVIHNVSSKWQLAQLMKRRGESDLDDKSLLELFLWRSVRGGSSSQLAEQLINHYGDFASVLSADTNDLTSFEGLELPVIMKLKSIKMAVIRLTKSEFQHLPILSNRDRLERYLRAAMAHKKHEELRLLLLDVKQRLVMDKVLHRGTIDQAPLYPREVVKRALSHSASAIILAHNHPSGDPTPSGQDIETTLKVQKAAELLDISFLDHLIVTKAGIASMRDLGVLDDTDDRVSWSA